MQKRIFTSESVTEGHPDKVCDQISDGVLDAILAQDPKARVACECCATTGMVMVMGEISTECYVDIPHVARDTICRIGYDKPESGFNGHTCAVLTAIDEQSGRWKGKRYRCSGRHRTVSSTNSIQAAARNAR